MKNTFPENFNKRGIADLRAVQKQLPDLKGMVRSANQQSEHAKKRRHTRWYVEHFGKISGLNRSAQNKLKTA